MAVQMESFFQLNAWRSTGVRPRGAYIRRTDGVWEIRLSSRNTTQSLLRLAFSCLLPVLFDSLLDLALVALPGS